MAEQEQSDEADASTRERLISTQCRACGAAMDYAGTGRRPRYCGAACRQHGWSLRQAGAQLERGDPRPEVVRETVARERVQTIRVPGKAPERAEQWADQLEVLRRQLCDAEHAIHDDIGRDTTQPQRLAYALASALAALDAAHPGAIDWRSLPAVGGHPAPSPASRPTPEARHPDPPLSRQQRRARDRQRGKQQ